MSKTIELTPDMIVDEPRGLTARLVFFLIKVAVCLTALVYAAHYVVVGTGMAKQWGQEKWATAVSAVTRVEVVKEYIKPESVSVSQLIPKVARDLKVPVVALQAVIDQESSGAKRLYRFEERKFIELKRRADFAKLPDDEIRMLASSHGAAHVMGFNAQTRCNVSWDKLYDPLTGIECGAKILRENLDRYTKVKDPSERLWFALRDYNGSGTDAEAYADKVMSRVGALLFNKLGEEL